MDNHYGFTSWSESNQIQGNVSRLASSENTRGARQADNPLKFLLSFNRLKSFVFDLQKDFYKACLGSDAIVYHPGAPIGYFIAQHQGIPSILATPFPMTPTKEYPALIFYDSIHLGKRFNLGTHRIFEQIMWFASSSAVRQFWKKEFGRLPADFACPYPKQNTQNLPTVISCSNAVFPRPGDWSKHIYNTGYWFLDAEAILFARQERIKSTARDLGTRIQSENGAETAAKIILDCSIHQRNLQKR